MKLLSKYRLSLRFKLFAAVSSLIVFFVLISWLLNNVLLEKFYFYQKNNTLTQSYNDINTLYKGEIDSINLELEKIESSNGFHITIFDGNFDIKYDSNQRSWKKTERPPQRPDAPAMPERIRTNDPRELIKSKLDQIKNGGTIIDNRKDERLNTSFIKFYGMLNNGDFLVISTPVAAIHESVKIYNDFFIITGIVTIILGVVLVSMITGKFTNPILQMKEIAKRMAILDFSQRYPVKTSDEIGQLGESINSLSEQLQKSIMELRKANQQLLEDIKEKEKIDEMRKDFISSVSHELKTPIALIQGYALGLKLNVNKDEENKNFYCDVIMDEGVKMNKLVKQLLELSQIESGMLELEKTSFNLNQFIDNTLKKNELLFKNKSINVTMANGEDIFVYADFDKIEQVLTNYLTNALNHIDSSKIIRVTVERIEQKARVSVFNSGKHINKENMEKIWTSFYKVDKARTRAYGGTGLGLSIVRAIQESHNNDYGVLNVDSGVKFWFDIDIDCSENNELRS